MAAQTPSQGSVVKGGQGEVAEGDTGLSVVLLTVG